MNQAALGMVLLAALLPAPEGAAAQKPAERVDVAILSLDPAGKAAPEVVRAADRCAARLAEKLNAAGLRAARLPGATLKSLRNDRRAPFAVQQILEHDRGRFSAELKLMDVASGEVVMPVPFARPASTAICGNNVTPMPPATICVSVWRLVACSRSPAGAASARRQAASAWSRRQWPSSSNSSGAFASSRASTCSCPASGCPGGVASRNGSSPSSTVSISGAR